MASARHVIVAGAGIAGLTAALAMARAGLRVTVLEQAAELVETGAGLQLSPNATRLLLALGLRERLHPHATAPEAIRVMSGGSGREIVRIPLGNSETIYGAPFWTVHRADLQNVLVAAARSLPDITLKLGTRVEDFAPHAGGVSVIARQQTQGCEDQGIALIGADGIWSTVATRLKGQRAAHFARRTAWRALLSGDVVPRQFRAPFVHLWLGLDAHLVHYPVKGGQLINVVAIVHDAWRDDGWSAPGQRDEILRRFARGAWHETARDLIALPQHWLKWALYERTTPFRGVEGPVTLIGDAAHPILPFLAQGAGMAIEDGVVLAQALHNSLDHPAEGLRAYERARQARTARIQRVSHRQGRIYGLSGPQALMRDLAMKAMGGERLRARYDWIYSWTPGEEGR